MVGKARSSNFTLSEKLDLLKLVRPHIRILEEHTNKHAVIVDKNKCWDTVAEQYNALGGDRPHRTAQGLRTLYKRLKESAKQEVMQRRHAQPEYRASISEPTRRIMEMIPHLFHHVPIHEKDQALRRYGCTYENTYAHTHTKLKDNTSHMRVLDILRERRGCRSCSQTQSDYSLHTVRLKRTYCMTCHHLLAAHQYIWKIHSSGFHIDNSIRNLAPK